MRVMLDQEQWDVVNQSTLGEVLAEISEKAHARARLITSLTVDQRTITDRDLDAALLGEPTAKYGQVRASSRSMNEVMQGAEDSIRRYGALLRDDARRLATHFRLGVESVAALDAWLGQLADYIEFIESSPTASASSRELPVWVPELLQARADRDLVRLADVLEYELAPRLDV